MRVVNLERLPDSAVPEGAMKSPQDVLKLAASGLIGFDEVNKAEALAELAAIGNQMAPRNATAPPESERDPRPLAEAIAGSWSNGMVTLTFNADGTATALVAMSGMQRSGHWSVDAQGRLLADVMGKRDAADAWVAGDQLTISQSGAGMTFKRA
jgi:hypothetical protein